MARSFKFSLADVLEHRINLEELSKKAYAKQNDIISALIARKDKLINEIISLRNELREKNKHEYSPSVSEVYSNYFDYSEYEKRRLDIQIEKEKQILEIKRKELIKTMQAREVIEKLKEEEYKAYRKAEADEENKFFDFLSVRKFCAVKEEKFS